MNAPLAVEFKAVRVSHAPRGLELGPFEFSLPAGSLTALVGPNGSGKSTLLKALAGEAHLRSGSISVWNHPASAALRQGIIAYVPQDPVFADHLSVTDLVGLGLFRELGAFGALSSGQNQRMQEALASFGLEHLQARRCSTLSIGERQRALLARAVVQAPRLLLLDEPTNHLDPTGQKSFWSLLRQQQQARGLTAIVATHDYLRARQFSDLTLALRDGSLHSHQPSSEFWQSGTASTLFGDYE